MKKKFLGTKQKYIFGSPRMTNPFKSNYDKFEKYK